MEEGAEAGRQRLRWLWLSMCLSLGSWEVGEVVVGWVVVVEGRDGWVGGGGDGGGGGGGRFQCWRTEEGLIQYCEVNGCTLHVKQKEIVLL